METSGRTCRFLRRSFSRIPPSFRICLGNAQSSAYRDSLSPSVEEQPATAMKFFWKLKNTDYRRTNADLIHQLTRDPFVDQGSVPLRIASELSYKKTTIFGFNQVRL